MIKLGMVDLDTSHPGAFLPILKSMPDVRVTAVWDGGTVYDLGHAEKFAREKGIDAIRRDLSEMVDLVDAVLIQSVNWDLHVERASPFIRAGKPVFIDKPMVGNLRDVHRLLELEVEYGVPIMGGSSLRYAYEIADLRARREELGGVSSVFASGPFHPFLSGDFFSYGVHVVEMFQGFLGVGVRSVAHLGGGKAELFNAQYRDGTMVVFQLGAPSTQWFLAASTSSGIHAVWIDSKGLYEALLKEFVEMLRSGKPPVSLSDSLESIKVFLAAKEARQTDRSIYLDDLTYETRFDGAAYAADYARARRSGG